MHLGCIWDLLGVLGKEVTVRHDEVQKEDEEAKKNEENGEENDQEESPKSASHAVLCRCSHVQACHVIYAPEVFLS